MTELKNYTPKKRTIRVKHNERHLWKLFHPYHYMTADLPEDKSLASGASFFTFYLYEDGKETLFGCVGVIPQVHKNPARRFTRLVILPEFQGLGLAGPCIDTIASYYHSKGIRIYSATFHPKLGHYRGKSPLWKASANNMETFKTTEENFKELGAQTGLRDGQKMFRYHYNPEEAEEPEYNLIYDVLDIAALQTKKQKSKDKAARAELQQKINKLEEEKKRLQEVIDGIDKKVITEAEAQKTKSSLNKMFKKNKRKTLTPEERKKLREEHAKTKN